MGMSASQARFLSLTARKTNVEFEGQQINQQRTTLSNQSAGYYSQLTNLTVPTPPSTQDYSRITYTFQDGTEVNTINQLIATKTSDDETGKIIYLVNYTQSVLEDNVVSNGSVIVNRTKLSSADESKYAYTVKIDGKDQIVETSVGTTPLRLLSSQATKEEGINYLKEFQDAQDYYLKSVSPEDLESVWELEKTYLAKLQAKYNNKDSNVQYYVRYQRDSETGKWTPVFYDQYQVDNAHYNNNTGNSISSVKSYVWGQSTETNEVKNAKARVEQDSSGRYTAISIYGYTEDGSIDPNRVTTYKLNATNTTDDDAYNDAMNKYAYDKSRYDKTIQDINSKIQIIQEQDKNLELKLKQLDTEQNAISTEIDAVKKVIQKNVESSFKTFSA